MSSRVRSIRTANVAGVWGDLVREFPALAPYTSSISGAVNAEYARMDAPVADGDEVAFLPPVSGGAAVDVAHGGGGARL